jgi:tetratricopeptide (TPR) repeat protein
MINIRQLSRTLRRLAQIGSIAIAICCAQSVRADLRKEEIQAYEKLKDVMPQCEEMVVDGRADAAAEKLLAVFPKETRTPAQSLLLGNLLFKQDHRAAYALHKDAAARLPNEADAQLEWAMEQHRAGEYSGASDTYSMVSKADPDNALLYGLWAECLLRTGKVDEAVKTWQKSEKASKGTLEALETFICDVNGHLYPDMERATLMSKTRAGDAKAAEQLIQLDCAFPSDWWNQGPRAKYLKRDLEVLKQVKLNDASKLSDMQCAAECGIILASEDDGDPKGVLSKYGFIFDPAGTLPSNGQFLSTMLQAAMQNNAMTKEQVKSRWGATLLERAKSSRDAEFINTVAHFHVGTDKLAELDQIGWDNTGDARFAASLLAGIASNEPLAFDNPILRKALKQFPEDSMVASFNVSAARQANQNMRDVLVQAIKAEYHQLSFQHGLSQRRGAKALRVYFGILVQMK